MNNKVCKYTFSLLYTLIILQISSTSGYKFKTHGYKPPTAIWGEVGILEECQTKCYNQEKQRMNRGHCIPAYTTRSINYYKQHSELCYGAIIGLKRAIIQHTLSIHHPEYTMPAKCKVTATDIHKIGTCICQQSSSDVKSNASSMYSHLWSKWSAFSLTQIIHCYTL